MSNKNAVPKIKGISLRAKITVLIIIISVYPMALMGIIAAYNYDNIIKERFISYAESNMNRISASISDDVSDMEESIMATLQNPQFFELINQKPDSLTSSIDMYNFRSDVRTFLSFNLFSEHNYDVGGIVFFEDLVNIFYTQEQGLIQNDEIPYEDMVQAMGDRNNSMFYFSDLEDHTDMYICQKVINPNTFKPLGILYYRLDPDYLESIFEHGYYDASETVFLYTKTGNLIASKGSNVNKTILEVDEYYKKEPDIYIHEYEGEDYYIITEEIEALDLTVISLISSEILTQDSRKVTDLIVILYIFNIPIFLGTAYFLYRNIDNPVTHLITKMNQFEAGNLDVRVTAERHDEFGYLFSAFNHMTTNINALINDVYIQELARKDAEISALQEQINPHFLYNTLESINWRAQLAGENDIALMIQALSKLMDASINRNNDKFITLEEEVGYMEQYMYLVQMRYSESLEFKKEISDDIRNCYVPKLIIQPLLENAVKHGIEPVGEGIITLKCYRDLENLIIEINDSGKGMGEYGLRKIRNSIELEIRNVNLQKDKRRSIGFQNVARRIELIYNGKAIIDIKSKLNEGTCIKLILPISMRLDKEKNIIIERTEDDGKI